MLLTPLRCTLAACPEKDTALAERERCRASHQPPPPAGHRPTPAAQGYGTTPSRPPPPPALTRVRGRGNENPRAGATAAGQGPPARGGIGIPHRTRTEADNNGVAVGPRSLVGPGVRGPLYATRAASILAGRSPQGRRRRGGGPLGCPRSRPPRGRPPPAHVGARYLSRPRRSPPHRSGLLAQPAPDPRSLRSVRPFAACHPWRRDTWC